MCLCPPVSLRSQRPGRRVVDVDETGLLQVGQRDPPPFAQIHQRPILEHGTQCPVGVAVIKRFRGEGVFVDGEIHRARDRRTEVDRLQTIGVIGVEGGLIHSPAQADHLHEVVEVPGLQRGVLTIVHKCKQFAGVRRQVSRRDGA